MTQKCPRGKFRTAFSEVESPAACDSEPGLGEGRLKGSLKEVWHSLSVSVNKRQKVTKIVTHPSLAARRRAVDSGSLIQDYARKGFNFSSAMSEWKRVMAAPLIAAYRNRAALGFLDTGEVDRTNEQTQIDRRSERQPLNSCSIRLMNRYLPCKYTAGVPA